MKKLLAAVVLAVKTVVASGALAAPATKELPGVTKFRQEIRALLKSQGMNPEICKVTVTEVVNDNAVVILTDCIGAPNRCYALLTDPKGGSSDGRFIGCEPRVPGSKI